jgi:tetratricopeptide (TPR) repeat protein
MFFHSMHRRMLPIALVGALAACGRPAEVSPADVPDLARRAALDTANTVLLTRFASALYAAQQCDSAQAVARRSLRLASDQAVAVLVVGQCDERADRFPPALALYRRYLADHASSDGAAAVRARELLAARLEALAGARLALQREQQLSQEPADPQTLAVLPLEIQGDSSYQPLSRGLAQVLTSDLSLLQRFKMVERLQLSVLMDEMHFGQSNRVDPATVARVGHLIKAGRLVQGAAAIRSEQQVRLEATVIRATGEVTNPQVQTGKLSDLLTMEKSLVLGLAGQLGYTLSEAERQAILENGTQNLAAFLSYSRGLVAEDLGDFNRAAGYYGQAVRSDPGFQQAKTQYQASAAAPAMQSSTGVATAVAQANTAAGPSTSTPEPASSAVNSSVGDLASTHSEQSTGSSQQVTQQASSTTASTPPPVPVTPPPTITGTVRIVFRLP